MVRADGVRSFDTEITIKLSPVTRRPGLRRVQIENRLSELHRQAFDRTQHNLTIEPLEE